MQEQAHNPPADLEQVDEEVLGLIQAWHSDLAFPKQYLSLTNYGPHLFIAAFPSVSLEQIRPLMVAGKLLGTSIVLCDKIIDRSNESLLATKYGLSFQAMQLEAYSILHSIFPPNAQFWERLRSYYREYVNACMTEKKFASGELPFSEYTETLALEIGANKSAIAKTSVAGLVELSKDDRLLQPLTEAVNQYLIARQLWDDIQDWKEDLQSGTPSLLLARVVEEWPVKYDEGSLKQLSQKLFYGGHISYAIDLALQSLDRAQEITQDIPNLEWRTVSVESLETHFKSLSEDIQKICQKNIESLHN
jgi:squalene-hopene/tetraprenyl-beta-curcumene cyclase